eukprot:SAG11_NODE_6089_length_1390_cov_5.124710_1_plen_74_part_00
MYNTEPNKMNNEDKNYHIKRLYTRNLFYEYLLGDPRADPELDKYDCWYCDNYDEIERKTNEFFRHYEVLHDEK